MMAHSVMPGDVVVVDPDDTIPAPPPDFSPPSSERVPDFDGFASDALDDEE